jgi:hypothetical protein
MSESPARPVKATSVRAVRVGHGANCSSIGSVIDTLFATATAGAAVFAAVVAALKSEGVRVAGSGVPHAPSERTRTRTSVPPEPPASPEDA